MYYIMQKSEEKYVLFGQNLLTNKKFCSGIHICQCNFLQLFTLYMLYKLGNEKQKQTIPSLPF